MFFAKRGAGGPVNLGEARQVERERLGPAELREIELRLGEHTGLDRLGVGAGLGGGQRVEEAGEFLRRDAADVLDGAQRAVGALRELAGEVVRAGEEIGIGDLRLADLVPVGRRDAAAGRAARLLGEDVGAVVLPGEVEQAVREVGHHRALVDEEAREDGVAFLFERLGLPPEFARVGHDAAADAEVRGVPHDDAGGEEVEFHAAGGVAGVGAAVDLEHHRDRSGSASQLVGDLGNEAALALVAEGDADIGDELAGKGEERHGRKKPEVRIQESGGGQRGGNAKVTAPVSSAATWSLSSGLDPPRYPP
jgi:hypothetical protein